MHRPDQPQNNPQPKCNKRHIRRTSTIYIGGLTLVPASDRVFSVRCPHTSGDRHMSAAAFQEMLVVGRRVVLHAGEAAQAEADLAPPHDEPRHQLKDEGGALDARQNHEKKPQCSGTTSVK